jgi:hypothetical protein
VVAGDDKLASSRATESMLRSVPDGLLDYHFIRPTTTRISTR